MTDTMDFMNKKVLPGNFRIVYNSSVCNHCPLKTEQYRVILVVVFFSVYEDDPGYSAASIIETNLLLNSIRYDTRKGYKSMRCDLKDFLLATPMLQPE